MRKLILGTLLLVVPGGAFAQGPKLAGTPVLISSDEECRLNVDGEDLGTVPAGGIKKIGVAPGEHLVSAVCPGDRRWKSTVTVGSEQKIVSIPSGNAASAGVAVSTAPAAKGHTGGWVTKDSAGRWINAGQIKGGPLDKTGSRPGNIIVSIAGKRAKDLTPEDLEKLDEGPVGSTLEAQELDQEGDLRKLVITREVLPESGIMLVLQANGKTIKEVPFDKAHPFDGAAPANAAAGGLPSPVPAVPAYEDTRTCQGYATPCGQRGTYNCMLGSGCFSGGGGCTGTPTMEGCFGKSQYACATTQGCFWAFNSCSGTASCSGFANQWACQVVLGCQWSDACTGFAVPCESLTQFTCAQQPGCMFR